MAQRDELKCPISKKYMFDPVLLIGDGNTYEREQIMIHLKYSSKSPMTNNLLTEQGKGLVENMAVRSMVREFLTKNPELFEQENEVYFPEQTMIDAINHAESKKVKTIFQLDQRFYTTKISNGLSAFQLLCQSDNIDSLKELIIGLSQVQMDKMKKCAVPADWKPVSSNLLLLEAVKQGDINLTERCLDLGADVNTVHHSTHNNTPLHWAAKEGHLAIAELLIKRKAVIDSLAVDHSTPLNFTGFYGHAAIANVLLMHGADVKHQDLSGNTPFHDAMSRGHKDVIGIFIRAGAEVDIRNTAGNTVLDVAKNKELRDWYLSEKKILKNVNKDFINKTVSELRHKVSEQTVVIELLKLQVVRLHTSQPADPEGNNLDPKNQNVTGFFK